MNASLHVEVSVTAPDPVREAKRLASAVTRLVREYELEVRAAEAAERDIAAARSLLLRAEEVLSRLPAEAELLGQVRSYLGDDSDSWEQPR